MCVCVYVSTSVSIPCVLLFRCSFVKVKSVVKASRFKVNDCPLNPLFIPIFPFAPFFSSSYCLSLFCLSFPSSLIYLLLSTSSFPSSLFTFSFFLSFPLIALPHNSRLPGCFPLFFHLFSIFCSLFSFFWPPPSFSFLSISLSPTSH